MGNFAPNARPDFAAVLMFAKGTPLAGEGVISSLRAIGRRVVEVVERIAEECFGTEVRLFIE